MSRINELMKKEESEDLEFKKKWRDEHLKTLSAFANSTGGELILGRDDKRKREIHYTLCEPKMNQNQFTKPCIKCQRGKRSAKGTKLLLKTTQSRKMVR